MFWESAKPDIWLQLWPCKWTCYRSSVSASDISEIDVSGAVVIWCHLWKLQFVIWIKYYYL